MFIYFFILIFQYEILSAAAGRPVIVCDDARREDEGDLIVAAEDITAEQMAFIVRHTRLGIFFVGVSR